VTACAAGDVEDLGAGKLSLIEVRGPPHQAQLRVRGDFDAVQGDVSRRTPSQRLYGGLETQHLFDRRPDARGVPAKLLLRLGVTFEQDEPVADQICDGVRARQYDVAAHPPQLLDRKGLVRRHAFIFARERLKEPRLPRWRVAIDDPARQDLQLVHQFGHRPCVASAADGESRGTEGFGKLVGYSEQTMNHATGEDRGEVFDQVDDTRLPEG
jgi:hypothetical protein